MKIWKNLLLISPFFLALILLFIKTIVELLNQGKNFDVIHFYFIKNLDFTMALFLIVLELIIALIIFSAETQQKMAGKWDIEYRPINWKGQDNPHILGKGNWYLVKSTHVENEYIGYGHSKYWDSNNQLIHKGFGEVRVTLKGKKVIGKSLLIWGEGFSDNYAVGDIDAPYVNPCIYNLNYSVKEQMLTGEAKMADGLTCSQFIAHKA